MSGTAVTRGAFWVYGYRWLDRLLSFLTIVVLARILTREDFGLVAIAASVVAILEGLSDFDVNRALIRLRGEERELFDTGFTLSAIRGTLTAVLLLVVTAFLQDRAMVEVLWVLALSPLVLGLQNPRFVTFERDLVYSRLALVTLSAKVLSFGVTVAIALVYRSHWALVIGIVVQSFATAFLTYVAKSYRPRWSLARWRDIVSFSGWMSLATAITTLSMQTDRLIVGWLLGVADAGSYYMTQRVGSLPTAELVSPLQRVLFPSFAGMVTEPARLRRAVAESVNVLGSLSLPAGIGFGLVANEVVPLVLGERWTPIVPLLQILVPYLGARATLSMALPCVMALGRTRLLAGVSFVYAWVHIPLFVAGTAAYGLRGAIVSIAVAGAVYTALNAWMLHRTVGLGPVEVAGQLVRPLVAASLMAAALFALAQTPWVRLSGDGGVVSLGFKVATGAIVYGSVLSLLWRLQGRPAGVERRALALWQSRRSVPGP
ncbi:MAG: lipopolysaccharide biosynthesis protein [Acidobacteriota bacterium]